MMRLPLILMALPFWIQPAAAQDWNNLATSEAMNQVHATMRQHMIVNPAEENDDPQPRRPAARTGIDPGYTVDPTIRRKVQQALIDSFARESEDAGEELAQVFARHDLIAMMDRAVAAMGLRSGDVIDAVTIYRLAMWGAAKGITTPQPQLSVTGLRAQTAAGFDLAGAGLDNPAKRQQFAETLLYQAVLMDLVSERAHKSADQAAIQGLQGTARRALLASGIDPDRMELTGQGFVTKR
ncbi:hypothetical protein GRI97_09530 [Altererythrobacter xixiisoli]|uniref:Uncharacterized protein n=1 Tax=Croceibacterium xixiisoli TaxID=1476466 RepID=A0A6I4TX61_9SPHN|nr:DUF6683 family protein [Croceibacterium xixiisoli]MXO99228.1 hypothetical protein [Croceibacterium xixiisoli]